MAPPKPTVADRRDLVNSHFDDPTFSDLKIKLSDRVVHVHRVVLCRGSEYFTYLLAGRFLESNAKEVELQEDDPEAMMMLLRYLYALPYTTVDPEDVKEACLQPHALVYIVAEKYQIRRLRDEAYTNMEIIVGSLNRDDYSFGDFSLALRTILSATMPDSDARVLMMQVCIGMLPMLREDEGFLSLLADLPDLAVDIIKHIDLAGDWQCDKGQKCGGLPACANPVDPKPLCTEPFERSFSLKYRGQPKWPCPTCRAVAIPVCSNCGGSIEWLSRIPTRDFRYYRWI